MQAHTEEAAVQASDPASADDRWRALAQARTAEQLCQAWLPILCHMIPPLRAGLLLFKDEDGSYAPVAVWPQETDPSYLGDVALEALGKQQGVVQRDPTGPVRFAYPLMAGDQLHGAVVLDLHAADEMAVTHAMRLTHWGAGWLIDLFNRRNLGQYGQRLDRSAFLLDLALAVLSEEGFRKAAQVVVNRLAQRFACHQVQLGLEKGKTVRVAAVSHAAWFEEKANLVNLAAQAMNEAFDQRSCIVIPEPEEGASLITTAHRQYGQETGSQALCSVPMMVGNKVIGVWLLERTEPFSQDDLDFLETLALAQRGVPARHGLFLPHPGCARDAGAAGRGQPDDPGVHAWQCLARRRGAAAARPRRCPERVNDPCYRCQWMLSAASEAGTGLFPGA